jgi:hypothetical protein
VLWVARRALARPTVSSQYNEEAADVRDCKHTVRVVVSSGIGTESVVEAVAQYNVHSAVLV